MKKEKKERKEIDEKHTMAKIVIYLANERYIIKKSRKMDIRVFYACKEKMLCLNGRFTFKSIISSLRKINGNGLSQISLSNIIKMVYFISYEHIIVDILERNAHITEIKAFFSKMGINIIECNELCEINS